MFKESLINQKEISENHYRKQSLLIYPGLLPNYAQAFHNSGNLIEQKLLFLIQNQKPIQFVGFWGVGEKNYPDEPDFSFLDELQKIQQSIAEIYPVGTDINLILADIHGQFNGYDHSLFYLSHLQETAKKRNFHSTFLSDLYRTWGLNQPIIADQIDPTLPIFKEFWNHPKYQRQREQMIESASRHARKDLNPEVAAFYYAHMRNQEKLPLADTFSAAILMVNGSKSLGMITLPREIPHMYLNRGPVWFTSC